MKTIDAVIEQCEEIANASKQHTLHMTHFSQSYDEWAEEWTQIAELLKELKAYKEQSGDAISRQAMHIELEKWITYGEYKYSNATKYLYDRIDRLPSVTPRQQVGRWIPVSERLPEDKTYVLTTIKVSNRIAHARSGWYESGFFHNDNGDTWKATDREVKAWMPLPEPYKAEREDKE